ncbi:hypothetical protein CALCODRAFT_496691 [Calocera cornea HHB12733]|uniref:cAMP-independent regulatory protein pac2 n=1 Tax=Calocera cornea HHB12733 TaxID=1353952 RepID=A0A165FPI0_9BASI|nr:hypothetical protein CALCODRAFT_496691 [Calocera cornea HHB12733]
MHMPCSGAVDYRSRGPTVPRAAVSSQHDALVIFEACRRGCLPVMRHRLADNEKDIHIVPGSVYVWEEAHASDRSSRCLRRWTDGVKWSQSRMREPFLFYEEVPPFERTEQDRRNRARHPSRRDRVIKPDGLKKLTFSALVCLGLDDPQDKWAKWHLVCYMTQNDRSVPGVAELPQLMQIDVPDGVYYDVKYVPLDNAPRQTVRWPRDTMGLTPPLSDGESTYSPQSHAQHMPISPISPPASPERWEPDAEPPSAHYLPRTPYGPPSSYAPASPHLPPYHQSVYRPRALEAPRQERLPPVSEVLAQHHPDLDAAHCPECARDGRHYVHLPPPQPSAQWGWTPRQNEDQKYLHMVDRRYSPYPRGASPRSAAAQYYDRPGPGNL